MAGQTPGAGEESIAELISLDAAALVASARVPEALAPTMAAHLDARMGQAILRLYRSAMQPAMRELGEAAGIRRAHTRPHRRRDGRRVRSLGDGARRRGGSRC